VSLNIHAIALLGPKDLENMFIIAGIVMLILS